MHPTINSFLGLSKCWLVALPSPKDKEQITGVGRLVKVPRRTQCHSSAMDYHGGEGWISVTSAPTAWERTLWECVLGLRSKSLTSSAADKNERKSNSQKCQECKIKLGRIWKMTQISGIKNWGYRILLFL